MENILPVEQLVPATYSELAGILARGFAMKWLAWKSPTWVYLAYRHPLTFGIKCLTACSFLAELWSSLFLLAFGTRSITWGWDTLAANYPKLYYNVVYYFDVQWMSWAIVVLGAAQFLAVFLWNIKARKYASLLAFNVWLLLCVMFFSGVDGMPPLVAMSFPPAVIVSFLCYIALSAREEFDNGRTP